MIRRAACLLLFGSVAFGAVEPETIGKETLGDAKPSWFIAKGTMGSGYVFDAVDGEMVGLLSLSPWTPSVLRHPTRDELYGAEVHYSRRYGGERSDIVSVIDHATLSPVHEIDIPDKVASLAFPQYLSLMSDERHLTVFNMTPAASVSVVDVRDREFIGEISTPGCALQMAVEDRGFLMLCGDGTLQLIRLDRDGKETARVRSDVFFSVEDDPVYDQPVAVGNAWQLISFEGKVFEVTVDGDDIRVSDPWSILTDEDEGWRVGGGQVMAVHADMNLLFVLMHEGGKDTHEHPGKHVWVFDRTAQRRIAKIEVEQPVRSIMVTNTDDPSLIVARATEPVVEVYDVRTTKKQHTINAGQVVGVLLPY